MCFVQVLCLHVEGNWGWQFIFVSLLSLCCYCSFTGWIQFESTPPAAIETNRKLQAGLSDWFMYHMVPLIVAPFMVTGGSVPLPLTGASGSAGLLFLRNRNVHSVLTMTHTHPAIVTVHRLKAKHYVCFIFINHLCVNKCVYCRFNHLDVENLITTFAQCAFMYQCVWRENREPHGRFIFPLYSHCRNLWSYLQEI